MYTSCWVYQHSPSLRKCELVKLSEGLVSLHSVLIYLKSFLLLLVDSRPRICWIIMSTVYIEQRKKMVDFPCYWENPMDYILFFKGDMSQSAITQIHMNLKPQYFPLIQLHMPLLNPIILCLESYYYCRR